MECLFLLVPCEEIQSTGQVQCLALSVGENRHIRDELGKITLGNILEILPFEDPVIVLELDGETLWKALESSLEKWPAQEG